MSRPRARFPESDAKDVTCTKDAEPEGAETECFDCPSSPTAVNPYGDQCRFRVSIYSLSTTKGVPIVTGYQYPVTYQCRFSSPSLSSARGCHVTARSRSSSLGPSSPAPFQNVGESTGLVYATAIAHGLLRRALREVAGAVQARQWRQEAQHCGCHALVRVL